MNHRLSLETLELRCVPAATAVVRDGLLDIVGGPAGDDIRVALNAATSELILTDGGVEIGRFSATEIEAIRIDAGTGDDTILIAANVVERAKLVGGPGNDFLQAGGGLSKLIGGEGNDTLVGGTNKDKLDGGVGLDVVIGGDSKDRLMSGPDNDQLSGGAGNDKIDAGPGDDLALGGDGKDKLYGGTGNDVLSGDAGRDKLFGGPGEDLLVPDGEDKLVGGPVGEDPIVPGAEPDLTGNRNVESTLALSADEVNLLLDRASAATASNDGIIVVVDRIGRILGVRVESGVSPTILADPNLLVFAIDGAAAKARTGAFFANNGAPLTSRTVEFISQSTMLEREIESNPNIQDPNSTLRGPGFVAPIQIGGHFPPVMFTPTANLFAIEHTNRDSIIHPGNDAIKGTGDDVPLVGRFNVTPVDPARLPPPESFGVVSGINPDAQSRGIGTLPGGIPIFKGDSVNPDGSINNLQQVGGIGVFFPGQTGFASEENSALSADFDPTRPDRSLEAEFIAFAALGGSSGAGFKIGELGGVAASPLFDLPFGRLDVDGITVPVFGPLVGGARALVEFGTSLGAGVVNGANQPIAGLPAGATTRAGLTPITGWIFGPVAGGGLSADDVRRIIAQGVQQALQTRAAIRLPLNSHTAMVFSVSDTDGNVLGIFRMPDATIFSIDVAVAKARNVSYYSDAADLQPADFIDDNGDGAPDVPPGTAFTNRTFRYSALPFFPSGIDLAPPGPFSILNEGQADPNTGLNIVPPLPASAFDTVLGFDAFNPGTNFRDPQRAVGLTNGIVFFPGSAPLYKDLNGDGVRDLVGGLGVSGDGVEQDDVVTAAGVVGFEPPPEIRVDMFTVRDVRLPYQKFNRNPTAMEL